MRNNMKKKKQFGIITQKKYDLIFFWIVAAIPLAVWAFNYFTVNGGSFFLAFQSYDKGGHLHFSFDSFKRVFTEVFGGGWFAKTLGRSFWLYVMNVLVTSIAPIFLAYFMYKKMPMSGFFKVVLYIPNIVSGVVVISAYKYMVDRIIPELMLKFFNKDLGLGLLSEPSTRFGTIIFQWLWFNLTAGFIMTIGVMNSTDAHTIEAGIIDGCNMWQEFWHIVLPHIYPTLSIGFIYGFSSMFTADFGLFTYFGQNAPQELWTMGYAHTIMSIKSGGEYEYPFLSAWGLCESFLIIPVTYFYKWVVGRFGPSED